MERAFSQKPFSPCSGLKAKAAPVSSHVPINSSTTSLRNSWEIRVTFQHTIPPRNNVISGWKHLLRLIQTVHGQRALLAAVVLGAGSGLSIGLSFALNDLLVNTLSGGLNYALSHGLSNGLNYALNNGLSYGLLVGLREALHSGLSFGLLFGLTALLVSLILEVQTRDVHLTERLRWTSENLIRSLLTPKHLRILLWRSRTFPWRAAPFFEDATTRILLRRIGGGYSFIHRLLRDHFAELNASTLTSQSPP